MPIFVILFSSKASTTNMKNCHFFIILRHYSKIDKKKMDRNDTPIPTGLIKITDDEDSGRQQGNESTRSNDSLPLTPQPTILTPIPNERLPLTPEVVSEEQSGENSGVKSENQNGIDKNEDGKEFVKSKSEGFELERPQAKKSKSVGFGVTLVDPGPPKPRITINPNVKSRNRAQSTKISSLKFGINGENMRPRKISFGEKPVSFSPPSKILMEPIHYLVGPNSEGFMPVPLGMVIENGTNRYKLMHLVGKGSTCRVFQAEGKVTLRDGSVLEDNFAVKIYSSLQKLSDFAEEEYNLLDQIQVAHAEGSEFLPFVYDKFIYGEKYPVLVYELLGKTTLDEMRRTKPNIHGFPINRVAVFANSIVRALICIHNINYFHGDLKPENVVITKKIQNGRKVTITKLIDFSSALPLTDAGIFYPITTIYYRAPELCLRLYYSKEIDIWSFGCLIFELFAGHPLFTESVDDIKLLLQMEKFFGPIPKEMIDGSKRKEEYLKAKASNVPLNPFLFEASTIDEYIMNYFYTNAQNEEERIRGERMRVLLIDLIKKCLVYNPKDRITLDQMLKHPFLTFEGCK